MQAISIGKNQIRLIALSAAILLVLLTIVNASAIRRQLDAWALLPRPERLTELYFADHAKLPTTYTAGVPQKFSFVTHNLEYRPTAYSYSVVQSSEDGKLSQPVASGSFRLAHQAQKPMEVIFTANEMGRRSRVVASITNQTTKQTQTIHYWLTNTAQPAPAEAAPAEAAPAGGGL